MHCVCIPLSSLYVTAQLRCNIYHEQKSQNEWQHVTTCIVRITYYTEQVKG